MLCVAVSGFSQSSKDSTIFKHKHMIRVGYSVYNPVLSSFKNLGKDGSSSTLLIQGTDFLGEKKKLSLTTSIIFMNASTKNIEDSYNADFTGIGLLEKLNWHWLRTKSGSFYSGIGLGYMFGSVTVSDKDYSVSGDPSGFSFQIDAFGIQHAFSKHFGTFAEFGYGYEGLFQFGLQFHW